MAKAWTAAKRGRRIHPLTVLNYLLLLGLFVITLYPFWYVVVMALSSSSSVTSYKVLFLPENFTLSNIQYVISTPDFFQIYANTGFVVIVGTLCSLLATLLLSYGLTQNVLGIRVVRLLVLFTMLFSGGMIPTYLIVRETGLLNNLWSLILPGLVSPFNTFRLVNALKSLPPSLSESAELDGAGTLRILFRIILPLSLPTMATLLLFYAVAYWNKYFSAILYVPKRENWVLQVLLRQILINDDQGSVGGGTTDTLVAQMGVTLKMATVVTAVIPIMLVYPFVQKYFIKGVMVGAVKE